MGRPSTRSTHCPSLFRQIAKPAESTSEPKLIRVWPLSDRHFAPHYFIPTVARPNRRPVRQGQQPLCVHVQPKCVILVCRQSERNCVFGSGDNQVSDPFWTVLEREPKAAKSRLQSCHRRIGQLGPVSVRFPRKAPVFGNRGAVPRERAPYRGIGMARIVPVGPVVPGSWLSSVYSISCPRARSFPAVRMRWRCS